MATREEWAYLDYLIAPFARRRAWEMMTEHIRSGGKPGPKLTHEYIGYCTDQLNKDQKALDDLHNALLAPRDPD